MSSAIDATKPTAGNALTADMRANFASAKSEIEALQSGKAELAGSTTQLFKSLNLVAGYTTTVTSAGTLTLTASSTYHHDFTGTTTHTVVLPDVTTLFVGYSYFIDNDSTGAVTVNSSGGNLVKVFPAGFFGIVTCVAITGTGAASWSTRMPLPSNNATVTATAGDAFTIRNTGTGNCLVVGDSTSPDATPFVIDASGQVIHGHTAAVEIAGNGVANQNHNATGAALYRWVNDVNGTYSYHAKSRSATIGSFSTVLTSDFINYTRYYGDDGTAFVEAGRYSFQVTGTPAAGNIGGQFIWTQRNTAGTLYTAMTLSRDGALALSAGGITSASATGGIGYATGAGGTVTQLTDKATGVTLNKVTGKITMNGAALASGAIVSFVLTNSAIAAEDQINCTHHATGTFGAYILNARCAAGSATIDVTNISAGSLSEAIVIKFVLIKAVAA